MSVFALLERLAPHIEREVNLVINSKQEAETLSSRLKKIQGGLQEAERKGVTEKSVKDWLKELENVTYEMDDVLDEWQTANLQVQLEGSESDEDTSHLLEKVRSLLLSLCLCFKQVVNRREITKKMIALSDRIDTLLTKRGDKYIFVPSENDGSQDFKQEQSTSLVNKLKVYGLDPVKDSLVEKLVSEGQESRGGTQIISIVGIGGVGKTTLAKLAYNDAEIEGLFSPKAWVSVSKPFDASTIAKAILEAFGESSADAYNLETLVQRIKKAVQNKRFLLVLDNVWTEKRSKWESLKNCLDGGKGSRVLVTTRSETVARIMGTAQWQPLGLLSDSDCGTILNGVALEGRREEECEKLRDIGVEIAKKCNGLPLAARSVGSMLALRFTEQQWRGVLESPLWEYEDEVSDLFRLMNLSYVDLSPLLKRCFLSSVVFPKGALISIDEITRIWMAYGYISSNGNLDEVQLKGLEYFNNLAMRSFFQKFETDEDDGDIISYKMHDIMHDFASYLSGSDGYSFIMDGGVEKEKSSSSQRAPSNKLPWNSLARLRTFCARVHDVDVSKEELPLDIIIHHLRSVRLLSMCDCNLQVLGQDVGKLIHLRYLNLSDNPIRELPETMSDMYNLQTLGIERCHDLSSLPQGIAKLINLRHLLNSDTFKLVEYPQGLEKLTGLWTLGEFRGSKLGYLRNLNQLQGSLSLSLKDLNESEEIGNANLWNKERIKKLEMEFGEEEKRDDIVDALKPPPNLQTLVIFSSYGKWLSHWIDTSFDHLNVVTFSGRAMCSNLPPFGKLPALEKLAIKFGRFNRLSIDFLIGGFPRLKKLHFEECYWWKEWEDIKEQEDDDTVPIMTFLEELEIKGCSELEALPHSLLGKATSLRVLKLSGSQSLYERYNKDSGYDRDKIPQVPKPMWIVEETDQMVWI